MDAKFDAWSGRAMGLRTSFRRLLCQWAIFSLCVLLAVADCAGSMLLRRASASGVRLFTLAEMPPHTLLTEDSVKVSRCMAHAQGVHGLFNCWFGPATRSTCLMQGRGALVSQSHLKVAEEGCASGGLVVGCCLRPQQLKRPPCRLLSSSGVVGEPRLPSLPTASHDVD